MIRRGLIAFALLAALVGPTACDEEIKEVGSPCGEAVEEACTFSPAGACILSWPEGYCTEIQCNVGSCPAGSRCVRGVTFVDVPFDAFCLRTCNSDLDCRDGYRCTDVSEPEKICAPLTP